MSDIPPDFVGYAGEPESELDIAFLMGLVYDHLPFRLVVSSINDAFPDCQGFDPVTKKPIRIEFEVLSRNYLLHDHPMEGCDYIVCWRDNWPESPIPVISIEDLIDKGGLEGRRFFFVPRSGSLRKQLDDLKERDIALYRVVCYFLSDVLNNIFRKHPGTHVDDKLTKHFSVRAPNGYGIFGFYPYGKFVCLRIDEFVKRFGPEVADAARVFRDTVVGIKMLRSAEDADQVGKALDDLLNAIAKP